MSSDKLNVSDTSGEEAGVGMSTYSPQAPREPGGEMPGYDICFWPWTLLCASLPAGFLCVPLLDGVGEMVWLAAGIYFKSQTTAEALLSVFVAVGQVLEAGSPTSTG